jgi:tetratricopeptide (TPR) repeat protein
MKSFFSVVMIRAYNIDGRLAYGSSVIIGKTEPQSSEAWYELGNAQERMGRTMEVEQDYRKAVSLNAKNIDALFRVGVIASQKGDKDEVHKIELAITGIDKNIADLFSEAAGFASLC